MDSIKVHKGNAVAKYFHKSKRIIVIADDACFHHAAAALHELHQRLRKKQERVCGCGCRKVESVVLQEISMIGNMCTKEQAQEIF